MSLSKQNLASTLDYPESDGQPMGETELHIQLIMDLRAALSNFFRDQADVYVGSNLLLYYVEGQPKKFVVPDVFVARGVSKAVRRIYKLWEEGCPPNVVIEVSSRGTWGEDLQRKWRLYAQLGVKEYYIFDPEYDYLPPPTPLLAYRLGEGEYVPLEVTAGRVWSEELGLELVDTGETLRWCDPQTGQFLLTTAEEHTARRRAEADLRTEVAARQRAEAEAARLRQELARLRPPTSSEKGDDESPAS